MCMLIRWSGLIPRRAFIPRVVYKVLKVYDDGRIFSMFRQHPYTLGALTETPRFTFSKRHGLSRSVHMGIHSYVNYEDALQGQIRANLSEAGEKRNLPGVPDYTYEIFECVVPRGAKYYKGLAETAFFFMKVKIRNIASNQIILTKQMEQ